MNIYDAPTPSQRWDGPTDEEVYGAREDEEDDDPNEELADYGDE